MDHTVSLYRVRHGDGDGDYLVLAVPSTLNVFPRDRIRFEPAWATTNWSAQFIGDSPFQSSTPISDSNLRDVVRDPVQDALVFNYRVNGPNSLGIPKADPQIIVQPRGRRVALRFLAREAAGVVVGVVVGVAVAFGGMFLLLQKVIDRRIRVQAESRER